MSKLKPCPFCGGEATIYNGNGNCFGYISIGCSDCGFVIKEFLVDFSEDDVVNKWGTRYGEQQLAAVKAEVADYREALECLIIEHGIHDSYDGGLLPDSEQSLTIQAAIKLLAKHKEE